MEINYSVTGVETHCKLLIWVHIPSVQKARENPDCMDAWSLCLSGEQVSIPQKNRVNWEAKRLWVPPAKDSAVTIHPHTSWRKVCLPAGPRRKFTAKVQWEQRTRLHLGIHNLSATLHSHSGSSNPQVIANINFLAEFPKEMRLRQSFFLAGFPNNFEPNWLVSAKWNRRTDNYVVINFIETDVWRGERESNQNLLPAKGKASAWDHHLGIRGSTQKKSSFGWKSSSVDAYDTKNSMGTDAFRDIRVSWPRWKPAGDPASLVPKPAEPLVPLIHAGSH